MLEMNSSYLNVLNRICGEVQKIMALKKENEIDWENVNVEVLFLYTMVGYKPVGVNRHFMMLLIHNKFSEIINHQISSKLLWDHLDTMYDLAALHESEIIPFPNDEVDFELPEDCHELLFSKYGVSLKPTSSENESTKNSTNSKASKKPSTPKLKQSNTPVTTSKSNFATPTVKPLKSETKTSSGDGTMKVKQDLSLSAKANKIKRSSSPFTNKVVKPESLPVTKEDSADISSVKKSKERGSSPATTKKLLKVEPSSTNSSSKKPAKVEPSANSSKPVKVDTSEGSTKKIKVDKDLVNKKGKTSTSNSDNTPISKKALKIENVNKKKHDDSTPKKTSETSSTKHPKTEVKSSSHSSRQDSETPPPTGSRKSSPVVKVKSTESSKKLKRPREETSKKSIPGSKRRRV